ncbi:MAG: substrate-binding domain-containing protein [Anaerolineaceae bacterium]
MSRKLFGLLIVLVLTACATQPSASEVTPQAVTVQFTPALRAWTPALAACAVKISGLSLVPQELSASALDIQQSDIVFRWGAPQTLPASAVEVGSESLVVIVHPQNSLEKISAEDIRALFAGKITRWSQLTQPEGSPGLPDSAISIYDYAQNDDSRAILESKLLGGASGVSPVQIIPDPAAMLAAVAADPDGIGYLPARWLTDQVKPLEITNIDTGQLKQPILALSAAEPQGLSRQLLLCLQQ